MAKWSALPTWWTRDPGLVTFKAVDQAGQSIAAIKVVMAVALLANFNTHKTRSSLSDLEELTGLSRPMVLKGVASLEARNILQVNRVGHINEYELWLPENDGNWGKLPYERLRKQLSGISNRGAVPLAALKIYLILISLRPNQSLTIALSHEKIRMYTGIQTRHVRAALDVLLNHSLIRITISEGENPTELEGRHNVYTLLGLTV